MFLNSLYRSAPQTSHLRQAAGAGVFASIRTHAASLLWAALFLLPAGAGAATPAERPAGKAVVRATPAEGRGSRTVTARAARPRRMAARRTSGARPGAAAMRVGLDPVTGRITRPGPESIRAARVPSSTFQPYVIHNADGSATAYLGDRFMSYSIVRYDSAGVAHEFCVQGREAAKNALEAPLPEAPARTVK